MSNSKTCPNCKHYQRREMSIRYFRDGGGEEYEKVPQACLKGFNDKMKQWWEENGPKRSPEPLTQMECFEDTDFGKKLGNMSDLLDKMNEILDKKNKPKEDGD